METKKASIWARVRPSKLVLAGEVVLTVLFIYSTGCYTNYVEKAGKVPLAFVYYCCLRLPIRRNALARRQGHSTSAA